MHCLNCGTEMMDNQVRTKHSNITYDMCEQCGSLWLDRGELDKMAFQVEGDIELCSEEPAAEQDPPRPCPRCDDARLCRVRFLGATDIFLHHCRSCGGFWLDGGQLDRINDELVAIMPVGGRGFADFVNNVHVPYWNQRMRQKSDAVEKPLEAMPIEGARKEAATTDLCPACGATLARYAVFHMSFEGCPACKGVWLFRDELRRLKNKFAGGSLHWLNDEVNQVGRVAAVKTNRACPKCGGGDHAARLVAAVFGHSKIVLDWCPQCQGTWLDAGALDGVRDYLRQELEQSHPREMEQALREELSELWKGGPESRFADLLDAKATISALTSATIFEHPRLTKFCLDARALLSFIA
ncbi:MAG: zf-TFIIB domain-containing protein [Terriglobales bacterium]